MKPLVRRIFLLFWVVNYLWISVCPGTTLAAPAEAPKKLYLIQDAHASSEAQFEIARIISELQKSDPRQTLFTEGVSGSVDLQPLFSFPDSKLKEKVAKSFVKDLLLSGAEYAQIMSMNPMKIEGVEDQALYEKNLREYKNLLETQVDAVNTLRELEKRFAKLKSRYYTKDFLSFDQLLDRFERKNIQPVEFYSEFYHFAKKARVALPKRPEDFFTNLSMLTSQIKNALIRVEVESKIDQASAHLVLLKRLVSGTVTRPMWEEVQKSIGIYEEDSFWQLIKNLSGEERPSQLMPLAGWLLSANRFYRDAVQREAVFAHKILERSNNFQSAVLLAGGFHTDGIVQLMKQNNISCQIILPKISHVDDREEQLYRALIIKNPLKLAASANAIRQRGLSSLPFKLQRTLVSARGKSLGQGELIGKDQIVKNSTETVLRIILKNHVSGIDEVAFRAGIPVEDVRKIVREHKNLVGDELIKDELIRETLAKKHVTYPEINELKFTEETVIFFAANQILKLSQLLQKTESEISAAIKKLELDAEILDEINIRLANKGLWLKGKLPTADFGEALKMYWNDNPAFRAQSNEAALYFHEQLVEDREIYFEQALIRSLEWLKAADLHENVLSKMFLEITAEDSSLREKAFYYLNRVKNRIELGEVVSIIPGRTELARTIDGMIKSFGLGPIVHISEEVSPFSMEGGQASVLRDFPQAQVQNGMEPIVITKLFELEKSKTTAERKEVQHLNKKDTIAKFGLARCAELPEIEIYIGQEKVTVEVYTLKKDGVRFYFISHPELCNELYIKNEKKQNYIRKAIFLSRASLEVIRRLKLHPDLIVSHDWWTGFTPAIAKADPVFSKDAQIAHAKHIYMIHNLGRAYQGIFGFEEFHDGKRMPFFDWLGIDPKYKEGMMDLFVKEWDANDQGQAEFQPENAVERGFRLNANRMNLTRSGIEFADVAITVSPGYKDEILTQKGGEYIYPFLKARSEKLKGISNGIWLDKWRKDFEEIGRKFLRQDPKPFDLDSYRKNLLEYKRAAKAAVQAEFKLNPKPQIPLIALVSRLSEQKGIELLTRWFEELIEAKKEGRIQGLGVIDSSVPAEEAGHFLPFQLLIQGPPSDTDPYFKEFNDAARRMVAAFPGEVAYHPHFSNVLRFYLGSNFLLMPSKWEPGGLGQLEAMAAGTPVIARKTGGLASTIRFWNPYRGIGNGFLFDQFTYQALTEKLMLAMRAYPYGDSNHGERFWKVLVDNAAKEDNSWQRSLEHYFNVYRELLGLPDPNEIALPAAGASLGSAKSLAEAQKDFTLVYQIKNGTDKNHFDDLLSRASEVLSNPNAHVVLAADDLTDQRKYLRWVNTQILDSKFRNRIRIVTSLFKNRQDILNLKTGVKGSAAIVTDFESARRIQQFNIPDLVFLANDLLDQKSVDDLRQHAWFDEHRDGVLFTLAADLLFSQSPEDTNLRFQRESASGIYLPRYQFLIGDLVRDWLTAFRNQLALARSA